MPRTVKTILDEDENKKPVPGSDEALDEMLDEGAVGGGDVDEGKVEDEKKADPAEEAAALRDQLKKEQAARRLAEERAVESDKRASTASTKANDAFEQQIVTRESEIGTKITNAKTNLDAIKQQLKTARAAGDTDAEVDLQDAMTNARYELNAAEWDQKNFAAWKENRKKETVKPANTEAQSPYTVKERAWIREHDEFNNNKKFARLTKLAAQEARDEKIPQDSPEYFEYIESTLKENGFLKENDDPMSGAGGNTRTSTSTAAAPQKTGGTAPASPANAKFPFIPRGFLIPPDWVEASKDQGFEDPREYANTRLEIEANEKANR